MICKLFVFRHAESTDNSCGILSGWCNPDLTLKGLSQAREVADQLRVEKIDYAFTLTLVYAAEARVKSVFVLDITDLRGEVG
jgi:broad specificity phosphatase PhoE